MEDERQLVSDKRGIKEEYAGTAITITITMVTAILRLSVEVVAIFVAAAVTTERVGGLFCRAPFRGPLKPC